MKSWIFKGLAYLATCGAAATTVLLTASSVGLKKSVTETFPSLSGLIQDRPNVKEDLLTPEAPPQKKQEPAKAQAGADQTKQGQTGDSTDDTSSDDAATTDAQQTKGDNDAAAGQNTSQSLSGGGAQGGVGGTAGGIECKTGAEGLQDMSRALGLITQSFIGMDTQAQGIVNCLAEIGKAALAPPAPGSTSGPPAQSLPS